MSHGWTIEPPARWPGDARRLARALAAALDGEVGFDDRSRALYATDASNYRQPPIGVVFPRHAGDAARAVALCREHGAPVVGRGGGTSLAGQCCNLAVVFDFSRHMNRVLAIDPEARTARVEPGAVLDRLRERARRHGLTFGPDPATHGQCTLGGMIGNNSCGVHSIGHGRTSDNLRRLEVLTYDGERMTVGATSGRELAAIAAGTGRRAAIYRGLAALIEACAPAVRERFPDIPRRVSGYNLDELLPENGFHVARALAGSEGTCALVLEAEVELVDEPPARALVVAAFADLVAAAASVPAILELGPIGLEGIDARLIAAQRARLGAGGAAGAARLALLPEEGESWVLIETAGGDPDGARAAAERVRAALAGAPGLRAAEVVADRETQARVWEVREASLGTAARLPGLGDTWEGWEDSAVPPARLAAYLADLQALLDEHGYRAVFYGHLGDGCLHSRIDFDFASPAGRERYRGFVQRAAELVVAHGGSLSGEHGDGQSRAELLPVMFGAELTDAFRRFKSIWDPERGMNPGKLCEPYPLLANLRPVLEDGGPAEPAPAFAYRDDDGRFGRAVARCVGVGKCRREGGGTMCPSWMVTRREEHSTRGRAHLLWEMLQGETIAGGWRSREVRDALELCLACKACKAECPAGVDLATYKAEFLSRHYAGRLRPRAAYALGLVGRWARLGARAPWLANGALALPGLGGALRAAAGIDRRRSLPRLARETFRRGFSRRPPPPAGSAPNAGRRVVLWPDTFGDHFQPEVLAAAAQVLERAGFAVELPRAAPCCGRPLYDFGMLGAARRQLRRLVEALRPALRDGVPVVVVEPSCLAVFRDELPNLLPGDPDALRLAGLAAGLAEFLGREAPDFRPPLLPRRALVHGHCHVQALAGLDAERAIYGRLGLDAEVLDSGCCGMAGAFGYQRGKVEVSIACAERVLLPAVRAADPGTLIVADGFSCRSQIADLAGRRALHTAEVLAAAYGEGAPGGAGGP